METYIETDIKDDLNGFEYYFIKESAINGLAIRGGNDGKIYHKILANGEEFTITKKQYDYLREKIEILWQKEETTESEKK